jgi:hypothetical protein
MILTANGTYKLDTVGRESIIYVSGSLGGGTATVGYMASGVFTALKDDTPADITLSIGIQYDLKHGQNMDIYVQLAGATAPSLEIITKEIS